MSENFARSFMSKRRVNWYLDLRSFAKGVQILACFERADLDEAQTWFENLFLKWIVFHQIFIMFV